MTQGPYQTHTLTLVVQRVSTGSREASRHQMAAALIEYACDLARWTAGNGVFERHQNHGCRIEAIASLPPVPGGEAREDVVAADGIGALRARIADARELAEFLAGGENDNEVAAALGYTQEQAAKAIREKLDETIAALPESDQ